MTLVHVLFKYILQTRTYFTPNHKKANDTSNHKQYDANNIYQQQASFADQF